MCVCLICSNVLLDLFDRVPAMFEAKLKPGASEEHCGQGEVRNAADYITGPRPNEREGQGFLKAAWLNRNLSLVDGRTHADTRQRNGERESWRKAWVVNQKLSMISSLHLGSAHLPFPHCKASCNGMMADTGWGGGLTDKEKDKRGDRLLGRLLALTHSY